MADKLADEGANKEEIDHLNLGVNLKFDLTGEKLATLTQALAYQGIKERKVRHCHKSKKQ